MKLRTNFSPSGGNLLPALAGAGWGIAVLGFALVVFLVSAGFHFMRENPVLKAKLEEFKKNPVASAKTDAPDPQEVQDLRNRVKALNALEAGSGKSVSSVLGHLEGFFPQGTRLVSFQQDQKTGEIQLTVEAESMDGLSKLLGSLEKDNAFTKVTLTKQSRAQGDKGGLIQFSIDMVESL